MLTNHPTAPTRPHPLGVAVLLLSGLVLTTGCEMGTEPITEADQGPSLQAEGPTSTSQSHVSADMNKLIAELRRFSAPFHNLRKAEEYGYTENIGCIDETITGVDPEDARGMGYHITRGDKDIVGDGEVDAFEPEFLVYTPENGKLKLAAFDYFVPGDTWTDPDPPEVLEMPMHWSPVFQGWVLHLWHFRHNPDGMFEDYNPEVPLCDAP